MKRDLAERGTDSLAKVFEGAFGLIDFMANPAVDVPGALGLSPEEWMERKLAGPVRLTIEERRRIVAELPEKSTRELADVLGVDHGTIARDRRAASGDVADATPEPEPTHEQVEFGGGDVADATPEPEPTPKDQAVHYSSERDDWETPQDLYNDLDAEFKLELDVCATDQSAKAPSYFTKDDDGLAQDWSGFRCWMNPPYGEVIGEWVEKAWKEANNGATVVCLVPARVDTGWWWDYCRHGEVRFLRGRLKFGGAEAGAPFPSAVVIFASDIEPAVKWWER